VIRNLNHLIDSLNKVDQTSIQKIVQDKQTNLTPHMQRIEDLNEKIDKIRQKQVNNNSQMHSNIY